MIESKVITFYILTVCLFLIELSYELKISKLSANFGQMLPTKPSLWGWTPSYTVRGWNPSAHASSGSILRREDYQSRLPFCRLSSICMTLQHHLPVNIGDLVPLLFLEMDSKTGMF